MTLFMFGYYLDITEIREDYSIRYPQSLLLLLTAIESYLVQFWMVRRRCRQWQIKITTKQLFIACLMAKIVVAIAWFYCPFNIMRILF